MEAQFVGMNAIKAELVPGGNYGSDLHIVNAARVSFGAASEYDTDGELKAKDRSLLNFLARGMSGKDYEALVARTHNYPKDEADRVIRDVLEEYRNTPLHRSPFNHSFLSFRITCPIFVARQLVKHEYLPWNEVSGRYAQWGSGETDRPTLPPKFYLPDEFRRSPDDKKQGSGPKMAGVNADQAADDVRSAYRSAYDAYRGLLARGVAEEQARTVLPLGTFTEAVWSGSVGAFAKMCKLRLDSHTQEETRKIAEDINSGARPLYPHAWKALITNGNF